MKQGWAILVGALFGMSLTYLSTLGRGKQALRDWQGDDDQSFDQSLDQGAGSFAGVEGFVDDPNALPDSEVFTHEDIDNHGPVVTYPTPSRVVTAIDWETNEKVEFKVFKEKRCLRFGTVIAKEHPREYALRRCATWKLCQAVVCDEYDMCILKAPTCDLVSSKVSTVYVIVERTARDIPLWHYLMKNLRPLRQLRRGRTPAAIETLQQVCRRDAAGLGPGWAGETKRETTEYPYIEVTKKDKNALDTQVMLDPIHKLVFFRVAKVMSTNLFVLYDRLLGHKDILVDGNLTMPIHTMPITKLRKRMHMRDLSLTQANQIMNDPSWKKIVFFRDPVDRFLSFYLNKMVMPGYCAMFKLNCSEITFEKQVEYVSRPGPRPYGNGPLVDKHYRQQFYLSNMYKFITQMDFVAWGTSESAELMLRKYGLWEKHGAPELWPYGFMRNGGSHATGSGNKYEKYYTKELEETVRKAYNLDYTFLDYIGLKNQSSPPVNGMYSKPQNSLCCPNQGCRPDGSK